MRHILLIDDDVSFRDMLQLMLEELGHHVTAAGDGKEGLAAHQANPADLVITDLVMPGMEGIETIIELRKCSPTLKIIAMSGGGRIQMVDHLPTARMLGASFTLAKPFTPLELSAAIAQVLQAS
jgi:CheY-like chemotaxis protein